MLLKRDNQSVQPLEKTVHCERNLNVILPALLWYPRRCETSFVEIFCHYYHNRISTSLPKRTRSSKRVYKITYSMYARKKSDCWRLSEMLFSRQSSITDLDQQVEGAVTMLVILQYYCTPKWIPTAPSAFTMIVGLFLETGVCSPLAKSPCLVCHRKRRPASCWCPSWIVGRKTVKRGHFQFPNGGK